MYFIVSIVTAHPQNLHVGAAIEKNSTYLSSHITLIHYGLFPNYSMAHHVSLWSMVTLYFSTELNV